MTRIGDELSVRIDMPYGVYIGPAVVTFLMVDVYGVELAHLSRPDGRPICNGYETGRTDTTRAPQPDPRFINPHGATNE